jgi:tellurite resistance protein
MHLVFVGFVLIPGSALPLGIPATLVEALSLYCLISALFITALTIRPLVTGTGTPPLRPLQGIQLAPPAFLTSACVMTGHSTLATIALVWATAVAGLLTFRLRWLTEGGFSGFWSAFTFPVTAFAGALLLYSEMSGNEVARIAGGIVLIATTLYVPLIVYRVLRLWAAGTLAARTNASIA